MEKHEMTNQANTVDKTDLSQAVDDVATDQMTVEQWLAIRKAVGLQIDPETAEVEWTYAQTLDPTESTQNSRANSSRSGGNTSPVLPEATCGCGLATCPTPPEASCGKSTSQRWRFRQDFSNAISRRAEIAGSKGNLERRLYLPI
jgi:hypothetical protein